MSRLAVWNKLFCLRAATELRPEGRRAGNSRSRRPPTRSLRLESLEDRSCPSGFWSAGPGTSIPNEGADATTDGHRTNVDLSHPVVLSAGTYTATVFKYDAGQAGDVRPFLATSNGSHSYLVLAVGEVQSSLGVSTDQSVAFGASNTFSLASATTVYAGISSLNQNPIYYDDNAPGTDHDSEDLDPVFVGATIAGFNHPDLSRQYAFSIDLVSTQFVELDIKPGSTANPINLAENGVIPMTIFGSPTFDVSKVDVSSVLFAGTAPTQSRLEDVNGDGVFDLVLHFRLQDTNLRSLYESLLAEADSTMNGLLDSSVSTRQRTKLTLTGKTVSGQQFEGSDWADLFLAGKALKDLLSQMAANNNI